MQLAKRVWDYSTSQDLLHDGDRVVVGVSGGPDSLCLLDVLHHLAGKHHLELCVAHLNHRLRPEAEAEADFVRAEAERRRAAFVCETLDIQAMAQTNKQSIETAARNARYAFFRRTAQQVGAAVVAVAHTADDQAETVLMHLLRGSGLRGLRGMAPKRVIGEAIIGNPSAPVEGQLPTANYQLPSAETNYQLPIYLVRPLLPFTRAEIMAYCAQHRLTPRLDNSNADVRFFRNRLRYELLPILASYNPNARAVLARTAAAAAGDYDIWLKAVHSLWAETVRPAPGEPGQVAFDRARWLALTEAEQRALLRLAAEHLAENGAEIDFAPLQAAVNFSHSATPGRSCQLASGLVFRVAATQLIISGSEARRETGDWPRVGNGGLAPGWSLLVEPLGPDGWSREQMAASSRWTVHVDAQRLEEPVQMRGRRPGDRFQPLGLAGHTVKLSNFLVNQKIPAKRRELWPLVTCGNDILWVVGLRLDERYKVTASTRMVTRLSVISDAQEQD